MDYVVSIPDQFKPQLRSLRQVRNLSQVEIARKLGVSQSRIAAIERNPSAVSAGQLLDYLRALGVELVLRDTRTPQGSGPAPSNLASGSGGEW